MFAIVQNKLQQTNKNKINPINDNRIKFEVSLHFLGIWPTVHRADRAKLCRTGQCACPCVLTQTDWPATFFVHFFQLCGCHAKTYYRMNHNRLKLTTEQQNCQ